MLEILDNICILLAKAEQKHFQYMKMLLEKNDLAITPAQLTVLYTLYKGDGISITELSKKSFLDNSTLTGLIDRMERVGLVYRTNVPGDRRAYYIYVTDAAKAVEAQVVGCMEDVAQKMLEGCSEEEIVTFRKVLLNIYAKL